MAAGAPGKGLQPDGLAAPDTQQAHAGAPARYHHGRGQAAQQARRCVDGLPNQGEEETRMLVGGHVQQPEHGGVLCRAGH